MAEYRTPREKSKENLRRQIIEGKNRSFSLPAVFTGVRRPALIVILSLAAAALLIAGCIYLFRRNRVYTTYDVVWSTGDRHSRTTDYQAFADGVAAAGRDGITCYNHSGELLWTVPYTMEKPVMVSSGRYLLLYDRQGQSMKICDENGLTGEVITSYPVTKACISQAGVVAAVLEDARNCYICYYDRNGRQLDIEITAPMSVSGYPLDIAISPDGQQLAVSYYYVESGSGRCRLDFYDFKNAKERENRIIAEFTYDEQQEFIPYVAYLTNGCAVAVGDRTIRFFEIDSSTGIPSEKQTAVSDSIAVVFHDEKHLCVLTDEHGRQNLLVYDRDGAQKAAAVQDSVFGSYALVGEQILMYGSARCRIVDFSGRIRLDMDFENPIRGIAAANGIRSLYLASGDQLQLITLK